MTIPFASGFTPEEVVRYCKQVLEADTLLDILHAKEERLSDLKSEVRILQRQEDRLLEQLYFAQTLLEELRELVRKEPRLSVLRKEFERLIDDSSFEL